MAKDPMDKNGIDYNSSHNPNTQGEKTNKLHTNLNNSYL